MSDGSDDRNISRGPETLLLSALTPEGTPPEIALELLDPDAIKVISRLRSFGHQAYLVGGCVRDTLLSRKPKDFDVATSAHPGEIRAVFRNCRLIGRRFRLAHVYFRGGKVIETATFRANPNEELDATAVGDLLITRDNVFGTAEEDSRRRDFTVNGLFYDVVLGRVIDYVGGREDLLARRIRTIGDPDVRFREDPVRLLRAVRFAAKLEFSIDPGTFAAMQRHKGELARCAPPRVLEEIFRLLRSGAARRCFELLRELGVLEVLLPPLSDFLARAPREEADGLFRSLGLLDEVVQKGPLPDDAVLLSALLVHLSHRELMHRREPTLPPPEEAAAEGGEAEVAEVSEVEEIEALEKEAEAEAPLPEAAPEETAAQVPWSASAAATSVEGLLAELVRTARLPRRIGERARLVLHAQRVLSGVRRRRASPTQFVRQNYFLDALLIFELYVRGTGHGLEALERWKSRAAGAETPKAGAAVAVAEPGEVPEAAAASTEEAAGERRKRRRGGRRRRRKGPGGETDAPEGEAPALAALAPAPVAALGGPESLPPEGERGPAPGPADLLPF